MAKKRNKFTKKVVNEEPVMEVSAVAPIEESFVSESVVISTKSKASLPITGPNEEDEATRQSTQQEIVNARQALVTLSDYVENGGCEPESYKPEGGTTVEKEPIFGGFYKVTNLSRNGRTFIEGDPRRIPCNSIHLNLKQVEELAMDGYTLQLLNEPQISAGYSRITKKNVHQFILKVKNMIEYGFINQRSL